MQTDGLGIAQRDPGAYIQHITLLELLRGIIPDIYIYDIARRCAYFGPNGLNKLVGISNTFVIIDRPILVQRFAVIDDRIRDGRHRQ